MTGWDIMFLISICCVSIQGLPFLSHFAYLFIVESTFPIFLSHFKSINNIIQVRVAFCLTCGLNEMIYCCQMIYRISTSIMIIGPVAQLIFFLNNAGMFDFYCKGRACCRNTNSLKIVQKCHVTRFNFLCNIRCVKKSSLKIVPCNIAVRDQAQRLCHAGGNYTSVTFVTTLTSLLPLSDS